jgi:hypothetical protein
LLDVEAASLNHAHGGDDRNLLGLVNQSDRDVHIPTFEFGVGRFMFDHLAFGFNPLHLFMVRVILSLGRSFLLNALWLRTTLRGTNLRHECSCNSN